MNRRGRTPSARAVTLKDIADRVGCSVTAVSKTLNGAKGTAAVSAATRERVLAVAHELGYTPNYLAQALQSGTSRAIGLVSQLTRGEGHDIHYWNRLLAGVEQCVAAADQDLVLIGSGTHGSELERAVDSVQRRRVDALIVPVRMYEWYIDQLNELDAPLVFTDTAKIGRHPSVASDKGHGIRLALDHLAALGHRDLIWLAMRVDGELLTPRRHEDILRGAAERGQTVTSWIFDLPHTAAIVDIPRVIAAARAEVARNLHHPLPGTALVAYSERLALGASAALAAGGYRVPTDVSLVSIDDLYAEFASPALTVVSSELAAVGWRSAEVALALAAGELSPEDAQGKHHSVPSRLIVRESTGPAPGR